MPMYDYRCKNCGEVFEELVMSSSTPDEEITCPKCKENKAEKLISAPMVSTGSSSSSVSSPSSTSCGGSGFT